MPDQHAPAATKLSAGLSQRYEARDVENAEDIFRLAAERFKQSDERYLRLYRQNKQTEDSAAGEITASGHDLVNH